MKRKQLVSLSLTILTILLLSSTLFSQVKFPEEIENYDASLHLMKTDQLQGGYWQVDDIAARDAIPSDKRQLGMMVSAIESAQWVTKRFEGVNTTNTYWQDDSYWIIMESEITVLDSLMFDTIDATVHNEGKLTYDNHTKSLTFYNDIANFNHNLGYEVVVRVYNETGAQIDDGSVVTVSGTYQNGSRVPTVMLAGNAGIDSLRGIGIATVDIPDNNYGIVTLLGEIRGLNTAAYSSTDAAPIWVGTAGALIDTSPPPPNFSLRAGYVIYCDNDSGSVFIQPAPVSYDPSPHISGDSSRMSYDLAITQNVFSYLPISHTITAHDFGFTVVGDSVLCDVSGFVTIALNSSYIGNVQSDIWRMGIFLETIEQNSVSRSTSGTDTGNSTCIATISVDAGEYISFKMTNESATRNPTINDLSYEIIFLHLE